MSSAEMGFVEEARNDIRTWRREDSVIDTIRKLLEMVVGLGLFARACCHTFIYLIGTNNPVDAPEVSLSLRFAPAVNESMSFSDELSLRIVTASYGLLWVLWAPDLRWPLPAGVQMMLRLFAVANVLVLVLDPLCLIASRAFRT